MVGSETLKGGDLNLWYRKKRTMQHVSKPIASMKYLVSVRRSTVVLA